MSWERVPGATIVRTTGSVGLTRKSRGADIGIWYHRSGRNIFRLIARELSEWEGE